MPKPEVTSKAELYRQMHRFQEDSRSAFSWKMLSELTGISTATLRKVFVYRTDPMTETTQIRVSKALKQIASGDVTVMYNKDRSRFLKYNQTPKPRVSRGYKVRMIDGKLVMQPTLVNRNDYSEPSLKEQLED